MGLLARRTAQPPSSARKGDLESIVESVITWLVRYLHVMGAAFWVGGYLLMAFVIVPRLARESSESLARAALQATRVLSLSGTLTIVAGLVLIARSRSYDQLFRGEWGGSVVASAVLAVAMMGIGDSGLRPALRRVAAGSPEGVAAARRWALLGLLGLLGLLAGVLALGSMTRAIYAR